MVSDAEPIVPFRLREPGAAAAELKPNPPAPFLPRPACFDRKELAALLTLYGRKVAAGEWRDYAIDLDRDKAVFCVFRRTAETPLFRIEKDLRHGRRQSLYSVIAEGGMILRRGHDLAQVLRVLIRPACLAAV